MHIIKDKDIYIMFDEKNVELYKLSREQGEKFVAMGDKEINKFISEDSEITCCEDIKYSKADRLVLVISQACNLACKYCYAQQGGYGENQKLMTFDTLKKAIYRALELYPEGIRRIQFFGGEPLLNFELMKKGIEWIITHFENINLEIPSFTIVTNGTLITPEIHSFFNKYKVNVTVSIDGNKEVNDINRIYKSNGLGTYAKIVENLEMMNEERNYILMLEMTVDEANIKQFKESGKLLDIESLLQFKPDMFHIVPAIWPDNCENCRRGDLDYIESLKDYFAELTQKSADSITLENSFNIMKASSMALLILKKRKKKHMCGAGLDEISISVDGDIYPCFAFIGEKELCMGNVYEALSDRYKNVYEQCNNNRYDNIQECKECWANGLCSNCIGNAYLANSRIDKPIKELCEVQKVMLEKTIVNCYRFVN